MCEPQLGRRGLYGSMGGAGEGRVNEMALLWVLNLSDGDTQSARYRGAIRPVIRGHPQGRDASRASDSAREDAADGDSITSTTWTKS